MNFQAYVDVSHLVYFPHVCSDVSDFIERHNLLVNKVVTQGYTVTKLRFFFKFLKKHIELVHL